VGGLTPRKMVRNVVTPRKVVSNSEENGSRRGEDSGESKSSENQND
jgi:hypothetical protein